MTIRYGSQDSSVLVNLYTDTQTQTQTQTQTHVLVNHTGLHAASVLLHGAGLLIRGGAGCRRPHKSAAPHRAPTYRHSTCCISGLRAHMNHIHDAYGLTASHTGPAVNTHTHTLSLSLSHTHTRTYIYIHTYTHTHTQTYGPPSP